MSSRTHALPPRQIPSMSAQQFRSTAIEDLVKKISTAVAEKQLPFGTENCAGLKRHMSFIVTGNRSPLQTIQRMCDTFLSLGLCKDWIEGYACFSGYSITWEQQSIAALTEISF